MTGMAHDILHGRSRLGAKKALHLGELTTCGIRNKKPSCDSKHD
jgi:hypothetical protein